MRLSTVVSQHQYSYSTVTRLYSYKLFPQPVPEQGTYIFGLGVRGTHSSTLPKGPKNYLPFPEFLMAKAGTSKTHSSDTYDNVEIGTGLGSSQVHDIMQQSGVSTVRGCKADEPVLIFDRSLDDSY